MKAFEKYQYLFMVKTTDKLGIKGISSTTTAKTLQPALYLILKDKMLIP